MADRQLRLRIDDWANSRHTIIRGNTLYVEVARMACNHCPTCSDRIQTVESRLRGASTPWRFVFMDGGQYLAVEPEQMPERVGDYLGGLLGLRVSEQR